METCCATRDCINKPNDIVFECHREIPGRACEGWKLKWTDPGPEVKVIHAVVPGPFDGPKILKALPYTVVSKCGCCAVRSRRRLRNGIPDPWLEYLEYKASKEGQADVRDSEGHNDVRFFKKSLKITDFVWQKKGLTLLQGIPDPWKPDLPCECEIKEESKDEKKKAHGTQSSRRRSSMNDEETSSRSSSTSEEETPRRKSSINEGKSPTRRSTLNEEEPPRRRSSINNEKEFPRRRSSNKHEETIKRSNVNYKGESVKRRSKSEEKHAKCPMCYVVEPSKTMYVCYGGIVPACLSGYFTDQCPNWHVKYHGENSVKRSSKKYDEAPVKRSSKKYDEEVPIKRKSKTYDEVPTDCPKKCIQRRHSTLKNEKKQPIKKLSDTSSGDSAELSVEALKRSRKQRCIIKHKVEKEKTSHLVKPKSSDCKNRLETAGKKSTKLKTCGSDFNKVKQGLQELQNELKAKEAAKELKLREMEQRSKLKKKSCKEKKRSGQTREKFIKQKSNGWLDDPQETMDEMRNTWNESICPRGICRLKGDEHFVQIDRSQTKKVEDLSKVKNLRCNKNTCRWLDEPSTQKKQLLKESSKNPKTTEARNVSCQDTKTFKTPLKSICKVPRPVEPTTPRSSPCPTNCRRVSYVDEPQLTSRTCSPNHRRVSYCDESEPSSSKACSPPYENYHQAFHDDKPVTPRSTLSKSPRCSIARTSSTPSPRASKESLKKFLQEINSRIEITQDALNSPDLKSTAVQQFHEETTKTQRCPGRDLCPRRRERAGGDEGSELFVRRIRVSEFAEKDAIDDAGLGIVSKFGEKTGEDGETTDASDFNAGADRDYTQRSYRRCSMADFKRRQKEIEELYVESFSERDC